MTDQRKEFEAWYVDYYAVTPDSMFTEDGEYISSFICVSWQAWQARGAKKVKLPHIWKDGEGLDVLSAKEVRDAIKAAGYEVE
jgi:hypothetical protein